jgi:hypothetical protein
MVMQEYLAIWKTKQRKYGSSNIAEMGLPGLVIRSNDKQKRVGRFVFENVQEDAEGSQEDAWFDKAGYALMGVMVLRGWWPDCQPDRLTRKQIDWLIKRFEEENGESY